MPSAYLHPMLKPRWENDLIVVFVVRISGPNQDIKSLDDQKSLLLRWLRHHYDGPVRIKVIKSRGKGELLGRPELKRVRKVIRSGKADLILMEDLGRMVRRYRALEMCEQCEDSETRLIALNDSVDTFQEGWQSNSLFAIHRHEQANRDTSRRIKRTLLNRFLNGELLGPMIAGYEVPEGATHDSQVVVTPQAYEAYDKAFSLLEDGGTYSEVADYFNEIGFPTGPECRTDQWNHCMASRVLRNTTLKGVREWNNHITRRENRTGRYISEKAPADKVARRNCPNLVIIAPERFDRVWADLTERNARFKRRTLPTGNDPLRHRPKKRTVWPGQHLTCSCCGSRLVYGAHGVKDSLVCTAAREYRCWQSTSVKASVARQKIADAIWGEMEAMSDFTAEMRAALEAARLTQASEAGARRIDLDRRQADLTRRIGNVSSTIEETGPSKILNASLSRMEREQEELDREREELQRLESTKLALPELDEIRSGIRSMLDDIMAGSQPAVRLLKRMIPQIVIRPYQLIDGGRIFLRAEFTLDLAAGWKVDVHDTEGLKRHLVVDLFEPVQREAVRADVVRLRQEGLTEAAIAKQLGVTVTAAQRAAALQRLMDKLSVHSAYRELMAPPEQSRLRRHLHNRFRQEGDDRKSA